MADTKLSALSSGSAVADADLFYSVQGGASVKQAASALRTYMTSSVNHFTATQTFDQPTHFGGSFSIAAAPENNDIGQGAFGRAGEVGFYHYNGTVGIYTANAGTPTLRMSVGATGIITLPAGYFQNTLLEACLAAAFTNATAALTATNLSCTLVAGRSYRIEGVLQASNSTAAEGLQFDFGGGAATATTFFVAAQAVGSVTAGTLSATSLTGAMSYTVVTGTDYVLVSGFIKVNAGGTVILRAAENSAHVTGTLTLGAGSWLAFYDTVPL